MYYVSVAPSIGRRSQFLSFGFIIIHMRTLLKNCLIALTLAAAPISLTVSSSAVAQSIQLSTDSEDIYVGQPFILNIVLTDFDENPQPQIEGLKINKVGDTQEEADVKLLGVSPRVSSMTTIINGRRTSKKEVKFVYRYSVTPRSKGKYAISAFNASQGVKSVEYDKMASFEAVDVSETSDMRLVLELPQRSFWKGESFEVVLNWYLRKDIRSKSFTIPMLEMSDYFAIEPIDASKLQRTQGLMLDINGRQVPCTYTRDNATLNGVSYTRFRIPLKVMSLKAGNITVSPSSVVAELESGTGFDSFGWPSQAYKSFKAVDVERKITIKELPEDNRPDSFTNALGQDYDIKVSADRTIVQAGDPIILTIDISSSNDLSGLILPALTKAGLNETLYKVMDESPIPETIDSGNGRIIKRFKVPVRVLNTRAQEVPPIAFSYFDPVRETYATVRSQPIALSVSAVQKVGVADVDLNSKTAGALAAANINNNSNASDGQENAQAAATVSSGLKLGVSTTDADLVSPMSQSTVRAIEIGGYASPFLLLFGAAALRRARKRSEKNKPQRDAARHLKDALKEAQNSDPKQAAARIANALAAFAAATETDQKPFQKVLSDLDAEAYNPKAKALSDKVLNEMRVAVKEHTNPKYSKMVSSIFALLISFFAFTYAPDWAMAQTPAPSVEQQTTSLSLEDQLKAAANAYYAAMAVENRKERLEKFSGAAYQFRALSEAYPDNAKLCLDWGNAAFNAADLGSASLAWRRALLLDPTLENAKSNLSYLDSLLGVKTTQKQTDLSSKFFFLNQTLSVDQRRVAAALLFFFAMLLFLPNKPSVKRVLRPLAILPLIAWLWMLASVVSQDQRNDEVVVMSEVFLKTADNAGSANVSSAPIQSGTPAVIVETRGEWVEVRLPGEGQGWLNVSSIEHIKK